MLIFKRKSVGWRSRRFSPREGHDAARSAHQVGDDLRSCSNRSHEGGSLRDTKDAQQATCAALALLWHARERIKPGRRHMANPEVDIESGYRIRRQAFRDELHPCILLSEGFSWRGLGLLPEQRQGISARHCCASLMLVRWCTVRASANSQGGSALSTLK